MARDLGPVLSKLFQPDLVTHKQLDKQLEANPLPPSLYSTIYILYIIYIYIYDQHPTSQVLPGDKSGAQKPPVRLLKPPDLEGPGSWM